MVLLNPVVSGKRTRDLAIVQNMNQLTNTCLLCARIALYKIKRKVRYDRIEHTHMKKSWKDERQTERETETETGWESKTWTLLSLP